MNAVVHERLRIAPELIREVLVHFLREETRRIGIDRAVVGLSGGIDSAVSAYLCVEAFGPDRLTCVMMPYRTSSPDALGDAQEVVRLLGARGETVEITPFVDPVCEALAIATPVRRGNVMARARMIVLYDVSARENALVIGTGNKTETLLGYTTQFGDNACAINPLGDLYKTHVRDLAALLGVPDAIRRKTPSADLWVGQTDEGELGLTYDEADEVLFLLVDERRAESEIVLMGYAAATVARIANMMRRSQFKRRPPIIGKISQRTVNADFRYARDWGT